MWLFLFSSSSHREDAAVRHELQPKESEAPQTLPATAQPGAPPAQEEPKEPTGPSVVPATSLHIPPKPAAERTPLPSKAEPQPQPERDLQPSAKPQHERADEEKQTDAVAGGQESFISQEEPAREAEEQLWAAVEETTAAEMSESAEEEEKQKEEGVTGG